MWTLTALLTLAQGAETEIVVYEPFARWDDTRWHVQVELLTPLGTSLVVDDNRGLTSYLFQVDAVIACDKTARLGKRRYEVGCVLEDVALRATTYRHSSTPKARAVAQEILDQLDAMLTGSQLQLQVDEAGGVNDVDLEGLTAHNERERLARESLRQVVARLASGFHLEIPDQAQTEGTFMERQSTLMTMPSLTGSQGSTVLIHSVQPWNGQHLVQSRGDGTMSVSVPAPRTEKARDIDHVEESEPDVQSPASDSVASQWDLMAAGSSLGGLAPTASNSGSGTRRNTLADTLLVNTAKAAAAGYSTPMPTADPPEALGQPLMSKNGSATELAIQVTYALDASAVALFDPTDGVMTERVWVVIGEPTPGSGGGGMNPLPYRNIGQLRLLDDGEHPDLGVTRQVSAPGAPIAGLPTLTAIGGVP